MNKMMIFENNNVGIIINEKGEPLFELYSTGMALGYVTTSKGRIYPHKIRINKTLINAEIEPVVQGVQLYLTEEMLYDFMLEAKTDKCKKFRKWVTSEVLPSIRRDGGYLLAKEDETEEELLARALILAKKTLERKNKEVEMLTEKNVELENELSHKEAVLEGVIGDITLAEKQSRINQIIRKGGQGRYRERYNLLYDEFDRKFHINSKIRLDNAKRRGEIKPNVSRLEYICKFLDFTNEIYEIALKLFEGSFDDLMLEWQSSIA